MNTNAITEKHKHVDLHGSEKNVLRPASPDESGLFYALTPE